MMMDKTLSLSSPGALFFSLLAFLFTFPHITQAGFGVSPALIQEQHLVPGSTFERTFYLIQGTPEASLGLSFSIESDTAKDWITILNTDNGVMTIPQGVQQFPVQIRITVPEDAEKDIHRVFIRANTVPKSGEGQVAIALAAKISLELTVGDEIFEEFNVSTVRILDIPIDGSPKAEISVKNTGNIPTGPDSATFELFNKFGDVRLAYAQIDGTIDKVPAFTEETIRLIFPLDIKIGLGEYWGTVKIYKNQKLVREEKSVFRVRDDLPLEDKYGNLLEGNVVSGVSSTILGQIGGKVMVGIILFVAIIVIFHFITSRKSKLRSK